MVVVRVQGVVGASAVFTAYLLVPQPQTLTANPHPRSILNILE